METKVCTVCRLALPLANFHVADKTTGRRRGDCKDCVWNKAKARKAGNPERWARQRLTIARKHRYGITGQQVETMLRAQRSSCAICGDAIDYMTAHLDHCHISLAIRGLLCKSCNWGLGDFKDDVERLRQAIRYLEGR